MLTKVTTNVEYRDKRPRMAIFFLFFLNCYILACLRHLVSRKHNILRNLSINCSIEMAPNLNDDNSLFNFVVKEGNGVKGLVDLGLTEVPDRYIQPPHRRINKQEVAGSLEIVTIDLSELYGPNHEEAVKAIVHASETLGFFQVVNHGVPLEVLESLKVTAHQFFGQPAEKKAVYLKEVSPSPLVKYGTSFVPENEKSLEWKDVLSMMYTNDADARQSWPNECKEVVLEYINTSTEMVRKVLKALIGNLGVKLDDSRLHELMGFNLVNINFYPACPNPDLTVGAGSHSDAGMLTVLLQDGIGGLYILSNGRYISAEHRVRTTDVESRVSVPRFIAPLLTVKIGPFPELVARDGVARYKEVIYGEYLKIFFEKSLNGKKSLDFALLD
ncbi:putative oxoglutarate/iron-dependent dioxygenase, non-heme dioxygenase domain-containing protein [Helianthus annuus]|nr:putative oxoglutarate/iron-dependent dioxygenase, non-heme dioxygenase domain-containing protein [Helianthus annuus]